MIVDMQCRVWASPEQLGSTLAARLRRFDATRTVPLDATPARLASEFECVSAACVLGFRSDRRRAAIPAEAIADLVRRHPGRVVGVAGIDPLSGDPKEQVAHARQLGLVGVTVSPSAQGFHPTHSSAMRVYEVAESLGLPIWIARPALATSECRLEFDQPLGWDEVARSFPRLSIILGGLGEPWISEALALVSKHERVFADLSGVIQHPWSLYGALQQAVAWGVADRLLLASGFPFATPAKAIEALYSVNSLTHGSQWPAIPRSVLKSIVERDALAAVGIDFEVGLGTGPRTPGRAAAPTPARNSG